MTTAKMMMLIGGSQNGRTLALPDDFPAISMQPADGQGAAELYQRHTMDLGNGSAVTVMVIAGLPADAILKLFNEAGGLNTLMLPVRNMMARAVTASETVRPAEKPIPMVQVSAWNDRGSQEWTVNELMTLLQETIEKIPAEFRDSAIFEIDCDSDYESYSEAKLDIHYTRPKTDEELAGERQQELVYKQRRDAERRLRYEELKREFEPPPS